MIFVYLAFCFKGIQSQIFLSLYIDSGMREIRKGKKFSASVGYRNLETKSKLRCVFVMVMAVLALSSSMVCYIFSYLNHLLHQALLLLL